MPIARDKKTGKLRIGPRFWIILAAIGVVVAIVAIDSRSETRADDSYETLIERCQDANPGRAIQWYLVGEAEETPTLARLRSELESVPGFDRTTGRVACSTVIEKP